MRCMDSTWRTAVSATLHCLTGCAIGEVLGMFLATWWGWGDLASILLAVLLAFFFGYLLTFLGVRRAGLGVSAAVRVALAADTVSILTMEVVDNAFLLAVPGAMEATLASGALLGLAGCCAGGGVRADGPGQPVADLAGPRPRGRPRDARSRRPLSRRIPACACVDPSPSCPC